MKVEIAVTSDFENLTELSREVENLFGPMANEESFQTALKDAIGKETVFVLEIQQPINLIS